MKNSSLCRYLVLLFFLVGCLVFSVKSVSAQQTSISISPSLNQIVIKPGLSTSLRYKITNNGDPTIIKLKVEPLENKNPSPINFKLLDAEIDLNSSFFLKNLESKEILINLEVPENTSEKDFYFNLTAESQPLPPEEGAINIRTKTSVQSLLLITVTESGQIEIKPKVSLFEVLAKRKIEFFGYRLNFFNSFEKIPVVMTIENNGKNMFKSSGEVIINGLFFNSKSYIIEPQTILAYSQKQLQKELPGLFWGSYTLSSTVSFGQGTPKIHSSTSVIIFPTKIFITLIILLSLYILLLYLKRLHSNT